MNEMRRVIQLMEAVAPTEDDLRDVQREFWDETTTVTFEPNFPMKYIPEAGERAEWFLQKLHRGAEADPEYQQDMQDKLHGRDDRPVVLFVDADGEVRVVVDGNHRIGAALGRGEKTIAAFVGRDHVLDEKAPPGLKSERFVRKATPDFQKRYGDEWEERLYGTAWRMFGEGQGDMRRSIDIVEGRVTEEVLIEGLINDIGNKIGNYANQKIQTVNDVRAGLAVIYRVLRSPSLCETVTFELKRGIKRRAKNVTNQSLLKIVNRFFPKGRGQGDFLVALLLLMVLDGAAKASDFKMKDAAGEALVNALENVVSIFGDITQVGNLLKALEIGNDVMFRTLNEINKKITAVVTALDREK